MRIDRLHVENFRKFANNDFEFNPFFNLIIGENGAGKSSILEALAVAVGSWLLGIRGQDSRHIKKRDIRREAQFIGKRFVFKEFAPVVVNAYGEVDGKNLSWLRELRSVDYRSRTTYRDAADIRKKAEELAKKAIEGEHVILPLISYYGASRLWDIPPDSDKTPTETLSPQDFAREPQEEYDVETFSERFVGYRYSVDSRSDLKALLRWMTYERRVEIDDEDKSPYLRTVLDAIGSCLPEKSVRRVRFSIRQETLMFDFDDGRILPLSDLSDGYRSMVAMIGDIACKAALLNPHLEENAISETPGVVLIDELDQHLHPRWQRRVVEDLRRTFPKIQFIATTHSPFLIQSLRSGEELIMLDSWYLDENGDQVEGRPTDEFSNLGIETIVAGIMGVEDPEVSPRYMKMLNDAKAYLAELDDAAKAPEERLAEYERQLAAHIAPYADNPAFQAVLEAEKKYKLGK